MGDFTAKDVQALRQATGAGMMDAKKALQANGGDMDAAGKWLREQGLAKAKNRTDRASTQGAVAVSKVGNVAAVVERVGTGSPEVRLYYDGALVHTAAITGAQLGSLTNTGLFRIARAASGEDCIDGVMDEVSFYSRALTGAEIIGIANGEMKAGGR